jgi:hypothetical protein
MSIVEENDVAEGYLFFVSGARYLAPRARPVRIPPKTQSMVHYRRADSFQKALILQVPRTRDVGFALTTVFNFPGEEEDSTRVTLDWVLKCLKSYQNCNDDVWGPAFLETVVFNVPNIGDKVEYTDEAREYLCKLGSQETLFVSLPELLPGPYALVEKELRDVWKLVDDSNGTCMTTLAPQSEYVQSFASISVSLADFFLIFIFPVPTSPRSLSN